MHDRAVAIEDVAVRLATNRSISGDIVVIATGSSYAHPFKASGEVSAFRSATLEAHEKLRAARSVAIAGAGAVGTELAGEIAAGMRAKTITLISLHANSFPIFRLRSAGGCSWPSSRWRSRFGSAQGRNAFRARTVRLRVRWRLPRRAVGRRPRLSTMGLDQRTGEGTARRTIGPIGRVRVDPWLRPAGRTNVFAFGGRRRDWRLDDDRRYHPSGALARQVY